MPLRDDPSLWFNLSGCVAAYQPIGAPGPLLARYNQAHGGDNRHLVTSASYPSWSQSGWYFNNAHYLDTTIAQGGSWTVVARWSELPSESDIGYRAIWACDTPVFNLGHELIFKRSDGYAVMRVGYDFASVAPLPAAGIGASSGGFGYINDVQVATIGGSDPQTTSRLIIGAQLVFDRYLIGRIQAFAIYVNLSRSMLSTVFRQMAYCHVNPDWSAWGRKRRYYYAPAQAAGGAVGIYSKRGAVALPGGVRIEAVQ